jgi:sugar phosphate isomerase/epimerase
MTIMKPVALQLYSVREAAAQDFPGVLKRVAEIGYVGVEFAGLHGMSPSEVRKIIDDLGLQVSSAHMGMPTPDTAPAMIEECHILGVPKLITGPGGPLDTMDNILAAADRLNAAVALLEGSGIAFGLHNHWAEFEPVDGHLPEDILLEKVPGMFAQLDVYWCAVGGQDPAATLARIKHRVPLLHIKDGMIEPRQPHTAVGSGVLDMPRIIAAADENVLEWLIVELDSCATDMFEAVEQSYRYLVDNGLAVGNR